MRRSQVTSDPPDRAAGAGHRCLAPWKVVTCLLAVGALSVGCTTVKPSQLPPDALRSGIRSGTLIQAGDQVSVVTVDGAEHGIKVSTVTADAIQGESPEHGFVTVAIDDVVALRKREVEPVRTTFVALGGALAALMVIFIVDIVLALG